MKKLILIAVALVILGAIVCVAAAAAVNFDLGTLDTVKYETNTYAVSEPFRSVSVDASVEKLAFRPAENGKCEVVCYEAEHMHHTVAVKDGTLTISVADKRGLVDRLGFSVKTPTITVYLPERAYADLSIDTDTGDIELPADFSFDSITIMGDTADVTCQASAKERIGIALTTGDITAASVRTGAMDLKVTTGRIDLKNIACDGGLTIHVDTGKTFLRDVTCADLSSEGTTGDISLDHVIAAGTISVTRDTGDVEFDASDAETIFVKTSTGDVSGTLLSDKVFLAETDTGRVDVPKTITGGRCEISTDTGDIRLEVRETA